MLFTTRNSYFQRIWRWTGPEAVGVGYGSLALRKGNGLLESATYFDRWIKAFIPQGALFARLGRKANYSSPLLNPTLAFLCLHGKLPGYCAAEKNFPSKPKPWATSIDMLRTTALSFEIFLRAVFPF